MRVTTLLHTAAFAASFVGSGAGQSVPALSIDPPSTTVAAGGPAFQVRLLIDDVTSTQGLGGYTLLMDYNPAVVRALGVNDTGYVGSTGNASLCPSTAIDHDAGRLGLFCFTIPVFSEPGPRTDEPQVLAVISLEPIAAGTTTLDIADTTAIDPQGNGLGATTANGSVTVGPRPDGGPTPSPQGGTPDESSGGEPSEGNSGLPTLGAGPDAAAHANVPSLAIVLGGSGALCLAVGALIRRRGT